MADLQDSVLGSIVAPDIWPLAGAGLGSFPLKSCRLPVPILHKGKKPWPSPYNLWPTSHILISTRVCNSGLPRKERVGVGVG